MNRSVTRLRTGALIAAVAVGAAACGSSSSGSSKSTGTTGSGTSNKAPITIGFITSETGLASSSYTGSQWGAQARIDAQNAAGGVNGHKLVLEVIDDQSNPSLNQTAAEQLVSAKNAFGVIEDTSFTFGGYRYLQQQGVPVTGAAIDGPEWGTPPNDNMFSVTVPGTPVNGSYYAYTDNAQFLKAVGVHKLATVAFGIKSAIQANSSTLETAAPLGISNCYQNNSVSFGATDMTTEVLAIKSGGCDGVVAATLLSTDIALAGALKHAGLTNVKQLYYTSYDQNLLNQPSALADMQGTYSTVPVDFTHPNTAAKLMLSRLKQYTAFPGGIPSLNILYGYASADLMIKGLQLAGANPTRTAFMSALRQVDNYDAGGLFPSTVTFKGFGTTAMFPKTACELVVQIEGNGYVPYNGGKPVCGTLVATKPVS